LFNKKEFAEVLKGLLTILSYSQIEKKKKKFSKRKYKKYESYMYRKKKKKTYLIIYKTRTVIVWITKHIIISNLLCHLKYRQTVVLTAAPHFDVVRLPLASLSVQVLTFSAFLAADSKLDVFLWLI